MTNEEHIREITLAFEEALKAAAQDLAGEYMKRLKAELAPSMPGRDFAPSLRDGAGMVAATQTQSNTLEALLEAAAKITPACGILVLRGTLANGWDCRGITSTTIFKRAILDCSRGIAAHVISTCSAAEAPVSELDPALVTRLGLYGKSRVGLVPVLLRDRPAALLLGLLPMGDELPALEVLAQFARLTLELQLERAISAGQPVATEPDAEEPAVHGQHEEHAHAEATWVPPAEPEAAPAEPPVVEAVASAPEPEAEAIAEPTPAAETEPEAEPEMIEVAEIPVEPVPVEPPVEETHLPPAVAAVEAWHQPAAAEEHVEPQAAAPEAHVHHAPAFSNGHATGYHGAGFATPVHPPAGTYGSPYASHSVVPTSPSYAPPAALPDPVHEKARRFAKLLVEEIKLYNSNKVAEGRAHGDLYHRLREDIEKSRMAYLKRYGQAVPDVDYFSQELMRILADNRRELMGAGFPG